MAYPPQKPGEQRRQTSLGASLLAELSVAESARHLAVQLAECRGQTFLAQNAAGLRIIRGWALPGMRGKYVPFFGIILPSSTLALPREQALAVACHEFGHAIDGRAHGWFSCLVISLVAWGLALFFAGIESKVVSVLEVVVVGCILFTLWGSERRADDAAREMLGANYFDIAIGAVRRH